jgi:glucose-6-phosphate 1-dehydrogenase
LVIIGASGDLTKRLLMPSLLNLKQGNMLPDGFKIVGMAKDGWSTEEFRKHLTDAIKQFATGEIKQDAWQAIMNETQYRSGDLTSANDIKQLAQMVDGNVLFYLAVGPSLFAPISDGLAAAGLHNQDKGWRRVIVEKPFGHDLKSAKALNADLRRHWEESQIYRIDHYLGKETVQNILAFRFANSLFEPIWNRQYIDHIQFTVSETVGVEQRGNFYDKTGALRDMVQNHLFQVLSYIAMDPPNNFTANGIRDRKVELINAIRRMKPEEVDRYVVRGQYSGYREEEYVSRESHTETYVAAQLYIDNWRWADVPFFLRTGKKMAKKAAVLSVSFHEPPSVLWRDTPVSHLTPNQLLFHIQPEQGVELNFEAKIPGPSMNLRTVHMRFSYDQAFESVRGTGYETLLYDAMRGDETLFARADMVEAGWSAIQPIMDVWSKQTPEFPNYDQGSWGPAAADKLIRAAGKEWHNP